MITPITPIGLSPVKGPADTQTQAVAAEKLATQAQARIQDQAQSVRKSEPEKAEEPARKNASAGGLKQPVAPYNIRLTVDKDPETGEVVYKSINRLTGEVVAQMPNAEVMEMKRRESYATGAIIVTDV